MAIYLSWADKLKPSERELRAVLAREPKHLEARTHLARVLSWQSELSEAIEEADNVLKEHPNNREASLSKPMLCNGEETTERPFRFIGNWLRMVTLMLAWVYLGLFLQRATARLP